MPYKQEVCDDIHPGDDQDKPSRFFVSEQSGVGHIFRFILRRADLPCDFLDQRRKIERPGGEEIDKGEKRQFVFKAGEGDDIDIHDHLHRIVGDKR